MRLTYIIIIWTLVISGLVSCQKKDNSISEVFPNTNQLVLFQVEYSNYAWGYSHNGIIIDSSGNVGYFKYPKNWHDMDSLGYISESEMNDNLSQIDTIYLTVDKNTLLRNFNLVQYAAEGEISIPESTGADMGETVYSAFIYDPVSRKYKQVLINQFGDWSRNNKSREANQILHWLGSTYLIAQKKAAGQSQ
jgi:hypothetical protein